MTHFHRHKDAPSGQQENVQALCHNAQPQHSCGEIEMGKGRGNDEGGHEVKGMMERVKGEGDGVGEWEERRGRER